SGDPDGHRGGPAPHAAGARRAAGRGPRAGQPLSQAAGQEGLHQDRRVPEEARRAKAPAVLAHAAWHGREDPADLRAHGLLAQSLPARPSDPPRIPRSACRRRRQARRPLRGRRGGGGRLPHAEGAGARAGGRVRAERHRPVPWLPGPRARRTHRRGVRRRHRGDLRAPRAVAGGARPAGPGAGADRDPSPAARRQPQGARAMRPAGDLRRFLGLLGRYLAPYWPAVALLVAVTYVAMGLAALLPVLMAPLLDLALGSPAATTPAGPITWSGLSLKNLGAAFFQWLGVRAVEDRFRAIVFLCAAYVAVGIL